MCDDSRTLWTHSALRWKAVHAFEYRRCRWRVASNGDVLESGEDGYEDSGPLSLRSNPPRAETNSLVYSTDSRVPAAYHTLNAGHLGLRYCPTIGPVFGSRTRGLFCVATASDRGSADKCKHRSRPIWSKVDPSSPLLNGRCPLARFELCGSLPPKKVVNTCFSSTWPLALGFFEMIGAAAQHGRFQASCTGHPDLVDASGRIPMVWVGWLASRTF